MTKHPRTPPDGQDSLDARWRYLRRRRAWPFQRWLTAVWVTIGAVVSWLFISGFAGLGH